MRLANTQTSQKAFLTKLSSYIFFTPSSLSCSIVAFILQLCEFGQSQFHDFSTKPHKQNSYTLKVSHLYYADREESYRKKIRFANVEKSKCSSLFNGQTFLRALITVFVLVARYFHRVRERKEKKSCEFKKI